jgi:hypothetical protein
MKDENKRLKDEIEYLYKKINNYKHNLNMNASVELVDVDY